EHDQQQREGNGGGTDIGEPAENQREGADCGDADHERRKVTRTRTAMVSTHGAEVPCSFCHAVSAVCRPLRVLYAAGTLYSGGRSVLSNERITVFLFELRANAPVLFI